MITRLRFRRSLTSLGVSLVVVLLVSALAVHKLQAQQPGTYSISGTAYKYLAIAANVLQSASVFARNLDPGQPGSGANSAADGTFTIFGLSAGTYALEARFTPNPSDPNAPTDLTPPNLAPIVITNANSTGNNIIFDQAKNTITGKVTKSDATTTIANANVNIFSMNGGAFFMVKTNASGTYTQKVGLGDFMVKAEPGFGVSADWMYSGMPKSARFDDNSGTTQTVDFATVEANVTVTGTIKTPTNTIPASGDVFVMLMAQAGFGQPLQLDANGSFSLKVGAGTYNLMVFPSFTNPDWTAGRQNPIVITAKDANTTKALGTITLTKKTDKITGKVSSSTGAAVSGAEVMAFQTAESGVSEGFRSFMGGNFSRTTSDASGNYTLFVTPGIWTVRSMPSFGGGGATAYVPSDPQAVTVTAGTAATANLTMPVADATVSGDVVDASGNALTSVFGFVSVDSSGGEFFGLGGPLMNGKFKFNAPAGSYSLRIFLPPGAGYSAGSATTFTVAKNGTQTFTGSSAIKLVTNNATVSGSLVTPNGTTVTKPAQVFAKDDKGNFVFGTVGSDGKYSFKVAPGTWQLNFNVDPSTGYVAETGLTYTVTAVANQTTTQNLTCKTTDSTISGKTQKADGTAVAGTYVTVDSRAGIKKAGESLGLAIGNSTVSDGDGNWTLKVPAGTYEVRASVPLSQGLINPKPEKVTVSATAPASGLKLVFEVADAKISGTTASVAATSAGIQSTAQSLTYVTAFSDKGGYSEAQADASGKYTLNVTNDDVWHVFAVKESGTTLYKSPETVVGLGTTDTNATQNLDLKQLTTTLPKQTSTTCSSTNTCTLKLSDGMTVTAPSSSLATSGNVTMTATPKAQLPAHASDRPAADYGYDLIVTDGNGQSITSFNSQVSVTVPYTTAQLQAAGVTAEDLAPKSWDTNTASWQAPASTTVDATNKTVTFGTTHFTNFAVTAKTASVPTVTVTSPASGSKISKLTAEIAGTISDPAATVTIKVGTTDQGAVSVNSSTGAFAKTVTLASGVNTTTIEAKNVSGTGSKSLTVENTLPTITKFSPKAIKVGKRKNATATLTITGTYYVSGAKVKVGPVSATKVAVKNSTTIVATLPIRKARPGKYPVTVTNPDAGSVEAPELLVVRGKKPTASLKATLELTAKKKGSRTITIQGTNFVRGTIALLDGITSLKTKVVSSKVLKVTIPLSKLTVGKSHSLVILGPDDQKITLKKAVRGKK